MHQRSMNIRFGGPMTPAVKQLMIINGSVFLLQQISGLFEPNMLEAIFGISHGGFAQNFMLWQPVTYMFLHGGWLHIFFNLLGLWMFGGELEQLLGVRHQGLEVVDELVLGGVLGRCHGDSPVSGSRSYARSCCSRLTPRASSRNE